MIDHSRSAVDNSQWPLAAGNGGVLSHHVNGSSAVASFPSSYPSYMNNMNPISPQSSLDSVDHNGDAMIMINSQEIKSGGRLADQDHFLVHQATCNYSRKRPHHGTPTTTTSDLGELQALALRMMRN